MHGCRVIVVSLLSGLCGATHVPRETPAQVKWAKNPSQCLAARPVHEEGAAIKLVNCQDGSYWQMFSYDHSTGHVRSASHPDKCLTSKSKRLSGFGVFLETCEEGVASMQFVFDTSSGQLRWGTNRHMCLDVTGGLKKCRGGPDQAFTIKLASSHSLEERSRDPVPDDDDEKDPDEDESDEAEDEADDKEDEKPEEADEAQDEDHELPIKRDTSILRHERTRKPFTSLANVNSTINKSVPQYYHFDSNKVYVSVSDKSKKYHGVLDGSRSKLKEFCDQHPFEKKRCDKAFLHRPVRATENGDTRNWSWVGCYYDMPQPRAMPQGPHKPHFNTKTCAEACAKHKYFALENTWCSCGDGEDYAKWGRAKDEECGVASDHDPYGGRMGRNWRNAVYKQQASINHNLEQCKDSAKMRCDSLEFKCGKGYDSACNVWHDCGECPQGQWCMTGTNTCTDLQEPTLGTSKKDMKHLWKVLNEMSKRTDKTAEIVQFLFPEIFSLEDLTKGVAANVTQRGLRASMDTKAMWKTILRAIQDSEKAEQTAKQSQRMTQQAMDQFDHSRVDISKMTQEEMGTAQDALDTAKRALSKNNQLDSRSQEAMMKAALAQKGITDVNKLYRVIQAATDHARSLSEDAEMRAKEAQAAVDSRGAIYQQADSMSQEGLQEAQEAHQESQESDRLSQAAIEEARQGLRQSRNELQTLFSETQEVQTVEKESQANLFGTRTAISASTNAMKEAQTSRYESDEANKRANIAASHSALALQDSSRALAISHKDAAKISTAAHAVVGLKTEAAMALKSGKAAIEKAQVYGKEANVAVEKSHVAVTEGAQAVKEAKQAEAAVEKAVKASRDAIDKSKQSVQSSKDAEKRTKEAFKEVKKTEKEAVEAVGKAVEARHEAKKSGAEVAELTSQLHEMESEEEKMEGVIGVLEKQTVHNGNTMDTIEAHETALGKILGTVKQHTNMLNETVTWTSALTEGLEKHQEVLDGHQDTLEKSLDLNTKQGKALDKHQHALESQQEVMNKTVKWVGALSESMKAHQDALEVHQASLTKDLLETAQNTGKLQSQHNTLLDATHRLQNLENKDAKRLDQMNGGEVLYATQDEVKHHMGDIDKHLKIAEANMVAINKRTLATKQLATLLHKHTNTLDANVQHMNTELQATVSHGQATMQMLHTIEANQHDSRNDIDGGMEKLGELHHQAGVFEQQQNQLRMGAHANAETVEVLEEGQKVHKKDLNDLHDTGNQLQDLVDKAHDMAALAQHKANSVEHDREEFEHDLRDLAQKFETANAGAKHNKQLKRLQNEAQALALKQEASQEQIDKALLADKLSEDVKKEAAQTATKIETLEEKTVDIEVHQQKMLKTTAFGLLLVVLSVFILACFMTGRLRDISNKLDEELDH